MDGDEGGINQHKLRQQVENKFPNLHEDGVTNDDNGNLPQLLKNEKDKQDFAVRHSLEKPAHLKSTAASKFTPGDGDGMRTQQFSNTMRSTDFPRVKTGDTGVDTIFNIKQGSVFDKGKAKKNTGHHRTKSLNKGKTGKSAIGGYRRRDLNPNNLFLRQQPSMTTYVKDPTNKFMKKPFLDNLPSYQKNFYANKKGFIGLFEDVTKINIIFSEVIETVQCYRPKLAQTLSNLNLSYNKLFERLLDQNHKSEIDKDKELKLKIQNNLESLEKAEYDKVELEKKIQYMEMTIQVKNAMIKAADMDPDKNSNLKMLTEIDESEAEDEQQPDKPVEGEEQYEKMLDGLYDSQAAIQELEKQQNMKKQHIKNMDTLLRNVLQITKADQGVQVDEGDLKWAPDNILDKNMISPLPPIDNVQSSVKPETADSGTQKADPATTADKPDAPKSEEETAEKKDVDENADNTNDEPTSKPEDKEKFKDKYQYEAPTANITKDDNLIELKKEETKINEELGLKLNSQPKEQTSNRVVDMSALKQMALELTEQWNVPAFIVAFISNSLDSEEKGRVVPWPFFKKQLFEIYNERIEHSPEINGAVNSNYLSLEEFLILYFLKTNKLRRLAEVKLLHFISSLKYYTKIWPRAKVFAKLTGMLQFSEPIETDSSGHSCDIFMQEFFYFAYSCLHIKGNAQDYKESDDGNTYVKCDIEEEITPKILFWLGENDMKKWYHKMRRHVKRIPDENEVEIEYVDMDMVLSNYLEEYMNKKQKNQKTITKHFVKFFQEQEGIFNTDEIKTVCSNVIPKENLLSQFVAYPDEMTFLRAFLFALTSQNNSFDISNKNFLKAVSRFGIDSPYPCIAKKLYLYGNEINIAEIIKEKVNTLEDANQMMLAHQTNVVGSNVVQRQSLNKNVVVGIQNMKMLDSKKKTNKALPQTRPNIKMSSVKFSVQSPQSDNQNKDAGNTSAIGGTSVMSGGKRDSTPSKNVRVVVPSFSTCSALFSQHFSILRELKKKIEKYKNMYEEQQDEENSWGCLENVMKVLDTALAFLNFPIQT